MWRRAECHKVPCWPRSQHRSHPGLLTRLKAGQSGRQAPHRPCRARHRVGSATRRTVGDALRPSERVQGLLHGQQHRRRQRAKRPAARHGQHCAGGRGVGNDHVTGRGLGCYWQSRFGDTADTRSDAAIDSAAARPGGSCETGKLDSWREQELSYHWPMLFLLGLIVRALARVLVLAGAADGTKDLRRFRDCARNRCPYGAVPGGRW